MDRHGHRVITYEGNVECAEKRKDQESPRLCCLGQSPADQDHWYRSEIDLNLACADQLPKRAADVRNNRCQFVLDWRAEKHIQVEAHISSARCRLRARHQYGQRDASEDEDNKCSEHEPDLCSFPRDQESGCPYEQDPLKPQQATHCGADAAGNWPFCQCQVDGNRVGEHEKGIGQGTGADPAENIVDRAQAEDAENAEGNQWRNEPGRYSTDNETVRCVDNDAEQAGHQHAGAIKPGSHTRPDLEDDARIWEDLDCREISRLNTGCVVDRNRATHAVGQKRQAVREVAKTIEIVVYAEALQRIQVRNQGKRDNACRQKRI